MAATKKGVWDLQEVRDKQLASEWNYVGGAGLWGWGVNTRGALGLNDQGISRSSPTQVGTSGNWLKMSQGPMAFSSWQRYSIKVDGTLWSWGYNRFGQLGLNEGGDPPKSKSSPTQVGTDTTWSHIAGGRSLVAAVKTDGTLWTWGWNHKGGFGLNQAGPTYLSSPTQVGSDANWSTTSCNYDGALAIKTDGTLWAWGFGTYGELGQNARTNLSSPAQIAGTDWSRVDSGAHTVLALKTDNTLWGWGLNDHGAIGANFGTARSSPVQIPGSWSTQSCGRSTSGGVRTDGTLWTWGSDTYGSGGRNNTGSKSSPIQIGTGTDWQSAHMGYRSGGAFKTDGQIWLWGRNAGDGWGVLGQNSTANNRSSPVQVPGTWEKMYMFDQQVAAFK